MKLDRKEVKALLKKGDIIKYYWYHADYNYLNRNKYYCVGSLNNSIDINSSLKLIMQEPLQTGATYDLEQGVFIYKSYYGDYRLIAKIDKEGIHLCSKKKR